MCVERSERTEERHVQSVWKCAARFVFVIFAADLPLIRCDLLLSHLQRRGKEKKKGEKRSTFPVGGLGLRIFARPSSHRGVALRYE